METHNSFIQNEVYYVHMDGKKIGHIRYEWHDACVFVHPIVYYATPGTIKRIVKDAKRITPKLLDRENYDLAWFYTDNDKYVKLLGGGLITLYKENIDGMNLYYVHRKDM